MDSVAGDTGDIVQASEAARPLRPQRKRRRPALACEECRRRKVKCDRTIPCTNCIRNQCIDVCSYQASPRSLANRPAPGSLPAVEPPHFARPGQHESTDHAPLPITPESSSNAVPETSGSTEAGCSWVAQSPTSDIDLSLLKERIRELEGRLAKFQPPSKATEGCAHDSARRRINQGIPKGVLAKTRYFGASHWMHGAVALPMIVDAMYAKQETGGSFLERLRGCKALARAIKAKRTPPAVIVKFGSMIPSREVCDKLVDLYFRTFETVLRILHIPAFFKQYNKFWEEPEAIQDCFLIQLQLVIAIGACLLDDQFSLRNQASTWLYEAQHWIAMPTPTYKARLALTALQNMCLLHIARETTAVGADMLWISAGELVRNAVYMGLHRDPDNLAKMPRHRAEVRRRLWATILEMALQASVDAGGPPDISLADFDTKPPSNYNDDQLIEYETEPFSWFANASYPAAPEPLPADHFTQTSIQIALYKSFPTRLAIAQYLNDFRSKGVYSTTLRLNTDMTAACRALSVVLESFRNRAVGKADCPTPSDFQVLMLELVTQRYFLALHLPWQTVAQRDPSHYYSRKVSVETAMKLYRSVCRGKSAAGFDKENAEPASIGREDFSRLSLCGFGIYRNIPMHCIMTLGTELLWQFQEERATRREAGLPADFSSMDPDAPATLGLGVLPFAELIDAMRDFAKFTERRVQAGETNIKGLLFTHCVLAQADGIQKGDNDEQMRERIISHALGMIGNLYKTLREVAVRLGALQSQPKNGSMMNSVQGGSGTDAAAAAAAAGSDAANGLASSANCPAAQSGPRSVSDGGFSAPDVEMTAESTPEEKFLAFGGTVDHGPSLDMSGFLDWGDILNTQGLNPNVNWATGFDQMPQYHYPGN